MPVVVPLQNYGCVEFGDSCGRTGQDVYWEGWAEEDKCIRDGRLVREGPVGPAQIEVENYFVWLCKSI